MEPDILYAVRPGEQNESLKLSLRSLANLPHRRVFIAGYCPDWVRGVTAIPVRRRVNKFDAIEENVRTGLFHPELGYHVVYMNDDFYFTAQIERVPVTHGGEVNGYLGKQELKIRMRQTIGALRAEGLLEPYFAYDGVHMPFPIEKGSAMVALDAIPRGALWRTWYGNWTRIGGIQVEDTKVRGPLDGDLPAIVSTGRRGLQVLRDRLEDILPQRCPYVW